MKKKYLFLLMTLLALIGAAPGASAWVLSDFTKIIGYNIASTSAPTTNIAWKSIPLTNGSVDFVALSSDAYISLITSDGKKVGNNNAEVKVGGTTGTFYNNTTGYTEGKDPGDNYKLHLTGMTAGSTYTFTIAIEGNDPKVTSFKLKSGSQTTTLEDMYVRGAGYFGWDPGAKMTTDATAKTAIYTFTQEVAANTRWKVANSTYSINLNNAANYTFKYSDGTAYDGSLSSNDAVISNKALPKGTVVTYSYTTKTATVTVPKSGTTTKTYTATVNASKRTDITAMTMTVTGATPAVTNKAMTKSGNNFTYSFESSTAPTEVTYSWNGGSQKSTWIANNTSNYITLPAQTTTYPDIYLRGAGNDYLGDWAPQEKFTNDGNIYTYTIPTGKSIAKGNQWKIGDGTTSGDWKIAYKNAAKTTVKYSDGTAATVTESGGSNYAYNIDFPAGTKFTFTYDAANVNNSTLDIVIPGSAPVITISKVQIVNKANSTLSNSDFSFVNGKWTLNNFTPAEWSTGGTEAKKHRIKVTLSDGTVTEYTINDSYEDYGIHQTTHDLVVATKGYFTFKKEDGARNITLTFDGNTLKSMTLSKGGDTPVAAKVNMPLKESDFANGQKHYFLVGNRTAAWRLQPEWELVKQADGTYALPANKRLIYNQYFGIAKVDSYDNYIHQKYTMYYNAGYMVKNNEHLGISLNASRANNGYTFTETNNKTNSMLWSRGLNVGTPDADDMTEATVRWSYPSVLQQFQITVNASGDPTTLNIQSTQTPEEVVKHRAFTLVGGGIVSNDKYTINGQEKLLAEANYFYPTNDRTDWQAPWVQYDEDHQPYIDGNGNPLLQTAWDADYLTEHPSYFDFTLSDGTNFRYNSNRITFVDASTFSDAELAKDEFADLYTMFDGKKHDFTDNDTHSNGNFQYQEKWNEPGGDGDTAIPEELRSYNHKGWQCFVVKDMWMKGQFKIWSGWGGNLKHGDFYKVDDENSARWYPANGGHGEGKAKTVYGGHVAGNPTPEANVYGCRMDVNNANFQIEGDDNTLRYYKRVILWYPGGQCGFNSAVLQLVVDEGGPAIQAKRADKNHLAYRWNIPDGANGKENVVSYKVIRRNLDTGMEVTVEDKSGNRTTNFKKAGKDLTLPLDPKDCVTYAEWFVGTSDINPGEYEYEIEITYASGIKKTAISNPVTILADAHPVTLKVNQRKEEEKWSFDLVLVPTLREKELSRESTGGHTGIAMAQKVRIFPADDATKAAVIGARANNATKQGWTYVNTTGEFTYTLTEKDKTNYSVPDLTIFDIAPNSGLLDKEDTQYSFNVELTYLDGDKAEWEELQYVTANATSYVYAPRVDITINEPALVKLEVGEGYDHAAVAAKYAEAGDTHFLFPAGSHDKDGRIENPAAYTLFNELQATATIPELLVTNSVKEHWAINYQITVNDDKSVDVQGAPTSVILHGLPVNATEVADISGFAGDVRHQLAASGATTKAQLAVSYTRGGNTYNSKVMDPSQVDYTIDLGTTPSYSASQKTWFQRDYAEANQASPANDRTLAFAQFGGNVSGVNADLNHYIGYHFISEKTGDINNQLAKLMSAGDATTGDYKNFPLYWKVTEDRAAQGGRVIGRRGKDAVATSGKFVDCLDFDYKYRYDDKAFQWITPADYMASWNFNGQAWSEKSRENNNYLPIEVGPIACGSYKSDLSSQVAQTIKGQISVVYPVYENFSIEIVPTAANAAARAPRAATVSAADFTPTKDNVKALSVVANSQVELTASDKVTGIDDITVDTIIDGAEYYNLQGIRVAEPTRGNIYIVRTLDGNTAKVLYK